MIGMDRLDALLAKFSHLRIALVGDLFLDRYLEVTPEEEHSLETGLHAFQVDAVRNVPGALGTIMNNLAELGVGEIVPVTAIGDDGHGFDLVRALERLPLDGSHIVRFSDRLTPTYTKPLRRNANGEKRELNRLDIRTRGPMSAEQTQTIAKHLEAAFTACDGLIVLDQIDAPNEGVVNTKIRRLLDTLLEDSPDKPAMVDSRSHLGRFTRGMLKGNRLELQEAAWGEIDDDASVADAAVFFAGRNNCPVFCTLSEQGILVAYPDEHIEHVPGVPISGPIDIVGAGDSVTAAVFTSLLAGATPFEAAQVGNLAASVTVQQIGETGAASPEALRRRLAEVE